MPTRSKDRRSFIESVRDCFHGLEYVLINEDNFKREIVFGILALIVSAVLKVNKIEFTIIVITISLVLFAEIINTAIEQVVDLITKDYSKEAGQIKDIAASGVLLMSFISVVVGLLIFGSKILSMIGG